MRAHIGPVVVKEFVFDPKNATLRINRGPDAVDLFARMVGRNQVFTPILNPFDRPAKSQCGSADQNIFGVELPTDAEPATNVTLVKLNGIRRPLQ